jgi:acetate kinase
MLRHIVQVAVFDTAFHQSIPDYAYMYPIPLEYYRRYRVRKYGFHGISHQYVAERAAGLLKKPLRRLKLITCHLGNGCSITAVKNGKSIDTSMGFTPLEGVMMGTRCGDIDPAIVGYLMKEEMLSVGAIDTILNKMSGLLGVSGISNDIREVRRKLKSDPRARLAWKMFLYRIKKYIGMYLYILGGADAIVFTAGIGENNPDIIGELTAGLPLLLKKKTRVLTIPTDEEEMIGVLTHQLIKRFKSA